MVNRKLLYWGVFLVSAGAVLLIADTLTGARVVESLLPLWPLLVIGLGVGLLLRRTRFSLAGGMLAAAMPGLALGGMVAAAPEIPSVDCRAIEPATWQTREGTFSGDATVHVRLDCGDVTITTAPGTGWRSETGSAEGAPAVVESSPAGLTVRSSDRPRGFWSGSSGDSFRVSLPQATLLDLSSELNAGRGRYELAGGRFDDVRLDVNAGDARVDLEDATVARLSMTANAASATVRLPATGNLSATFDVNAAGLVICAPADLGLRIRELDSTLGSSTYNGLVASGGAWESPNYSSAAYHADMTVTVNVGSVDVNPEGGCK